MFSQSITQAITFACIAIFALFVMADSKLSAQEIFGGRGISGDVIGSNSSYSNPLGTQSSNPLAGILKKPAFLENLKIPTIEFKKPNFDLLNPSGTQSAGSGFLSNLPKLGNLIPQRDPGQRSMLGKMKDKTDAFFAKAFAFEKLMPGRQQVAKDEQEWNALRESMQRVMAGRASEVSGQTANATNGSLLR